MNEKILVVDQYDQIISWEDKLKVHQKGILHRAFSILIYSKKGDKMLLQKRSKLKYHSPNLWTNACCSHEKKDLFEQGLNINDMAILRLKKELNIDKINIKFEKKIKYYEKVGDYIENEIDYVFIGTLEENIKIHFNKEEVAEIKWINIEELKIDIQQNHTIYTPWLKYLI